MKADGIDRSVAALGRNLRAMSVGTFGSALLQYLLFFGITRFLGAETYGDFALALTVAVLAAPLCDLGMGVAMVRTCSQRPEALPSIVRTSLLWRVALLFPVATGVWLFGAAAGYSPAIMQLVWLMFAASYLDGAGSLASAVFQAREDMRYSAAIMILRNLMRCAAFGAALLLRSSPHELALWIALSALVAVIPPWWLILRALPRERCAPLVTTLATAAPFGIAIIAVMLHTQVDVVMLGWFRASDEVGVYHAGVRFYVLALMIPQVVAVAFAPLDNKLGLRGAAAVGQVYRAKTIALGLLGLLGSGLLCVHGQLLVEHILGAGFASSSVIVIAIAPVIFIRFLSIPLEDSMVAVGRQQAFSVACCLALLMNFTCNLILIPELGALGAVIATAASELAYLLLMASLLSAAGVRLGWTHLFAQPLLAVFLAAVTWTTAHFLAVPHGNSVALVVGIGSYLWLAHRRPPPEVRMIATHLTIPLVGINAPAPHGDGNGL